MHANACKYHMQWLHKAEDPGNCHQHQQFYRLFPYQQVNLGCTRFLQEQKQTKLGSKGDD